MEGIKRNLDIKYPVGLSVIETQMHQVTHLTKPWDRTPHDCFHLVTIRVHLLIQS